MSKTDLETLKERIAATYDPDYIVDALQLSSEDLLDAFEEKLVELVSNFSELENDE